MKKKALIIGAGPAGLTAAYELLTRTDIVPLIIEKSGDIGGLSKTLNYKGNRIDIGGHRFFSKSDRVMKWWLNILPVYQPPGQDITINYHNKTTLLKHSDLKTTESADEEKMMLVRNRLSRIFYLKKFFNYPISFSLDTVKKLGVVKLIRVITSYVKSRLFSRKEISLEDFFIKRFGKELYLTFFKDYTEKVWGSECKDIPAEWGKQRIKELSISKAIIHSIKQKLPSFDSDDVSQTDKHTSLIERFLYPKLGPGQLWEEVAAIIIEKGGEISFHESVSTIHHNGNNQLLSVETVNTETASTNRYEADYFFSSMPVKELISSLNPAAPIEVGSAAQGLLYRDFITVGLLLKKLNITEGKLSVTGLIKDNWIYVQDHSVKVGRIQIFNNWSPYMVKNPDTVWIGLEYFCQKDDELWVMKDDKFISFSIGELVSIGFIAREDVLDSTVIRVEKTYPSYLGTYDQFPIISNYTDKFENLFLVGRNGMHKYNNADHSMLTAMTAVDNIIEGIRSKESIWKINTDQEYHENK